MLQQTSQKNIKVNLNSEYGLLNAVLLHRPGVEIERMTPQNASKALYSDILNKPIVDQEYSNFCGVLERWTKVYYVMDLVAELLANNTTKEFLVRESCRHDKCEYLIDELLGHDNTTLARELIEGVEHPKCAERYALKPLYNLFFTRDASSSVYDRVLINSMSFEVRERETLLYKTIFEQYFGAQLLNAQSWNPEAHTEGGDVQIARPDLLCIGQGIRTNKLGIEYLAQTFGKERERFYIISQELPHEPESFIHLDMVFTFLSGNQCMAYEPMLKKTDNFAGKATTLISIEGGKASYREYPNILKALSAVGMEMEPVLCGGSDFWMQQREQWHSGANFFALGPGKVLGYHRNTHTIEALDKAGFSILNAEDICSGKVDMHQYEKFVAAFKASELPRGGGGARCMTMPINRV
ncbi:MAG: arginine deiminase [Bacteroidales bacterium]|nr:arginine deiminase [Candidatus Colimorpha pelethequi]